MLLIAWSLKWFVFGKEEMNQQAETRVPTVEPGLTKGTWGQKGTQVPRTKIKKYFRRKLQKNINIDKIIDKTDNFDKKSRIFWLIICGK